MHSCLSNATWQYEGRLPSCDKQSSACQERRAWVRAAEQRRAEAERDGEALHSTSCDSITQVRTRPGMPFVSAMDSTVSDMGTDQKLCSAPAQGFH